MADALAATAGAAFDRRLEARSPAPIALALSGGGDSVALLLLASAWCAARGRPLLALTVDHRLNPDSAAWTALAGEAARAAGADWRALAWEGPKPAAGLPAAARAARHRLLAEAARAAGARALLVAHTADDVAEGELMRQADAPRLGRLQEWSPSPAWPEGRGLFILRPLLALGRLQLREWLSARGARWIEDPANHDLRFARARARQALGTGAVPPAALPPGAPPGPLPTATPDGRLVLPRAALRSPGAERVLAAALLCAAGTARPPRRERLLRLSQALAGDGAVQATLAGARVSANGGEVQFGRDAGERFRGGLAPLPLEAGEATAWDGRFELTADEAGWTVQALGGHVAALPAPERRSLAVIPPWARGGLPVLTGPNGEARLPRPFGGGPARAQALAGPRMAAACGLIAREAEIAEAPHGAGAFATLCSAPADRLAVAGALSPA